MKKPSTYVVITPAKNEAQFIELTIRSMIAQSVRPLKWVIVSDGSTDGTDDIVKRYAAEHDWIELVRMPERTERHFAGKVGAFRAGAERVQGLPYEFICGLDGDISFGPEHFEFLLGKLADNPRLGLVGTPFEEDGVTYDYRFASVEHVSGACQLFRRTCFEEIGGYQPLKSGGIDLVAVLSARMKGWQVRTFVERTCRHHRKQGSANKSGLAVIANDGRKDYLLGADPMWQILRVGYRLLKRPYIIGGLSLASGYFWPMLRRIPRTAPRDVIAFRRQDQKARLYALLRRFTIGGHRAAAAKVAGRP
jgi:poly-beta-1,6-N-acetyl-D-glucosamine synthase